MRTPFTSHLLALALPLLAACSDAESSAGEAAPISGIPADSPERAVIDTRDPRTFAAGHDPGALNLQWGWDQLDGRVASYLPERGTPIALRSRSAEDAAKSKALLQAAGYDDVAVLEGETGSETLSVIGVDELAERLAGEDPPIVIDVRTPGEWEQGVIPGAITVAQDEAPGILSELDPEAEYAVICAGGYRSGQFASLLRAEGFDHVHNVIDGMGAWYRRQ